MTTQWQDKYRDRIGSVVEAMKLIRSGNTIFIGTGCGQPGDLVDALANHCTHVRDVNIVHLLTMGDAPYIQAKHSGRFQVNTFFVSENVRDAVEHSLGDYTPIFMSEIPQEFESGRIPIDVALVNVSEPDDNGLCSFGVSVDIVKSAAANASYVVAQVSSTMPRTLGNCFIHVDQIDMMIPSDREIIETVSPKLEPRHKKIGENVAHLVEDGSTIECGIGNVSQAVAEFLKHKKNLGIHTELLSDWVIDLVECGAINGSKKTINNGKIVASFAMGSRKLYDFIDNNPTIEFHPTEYVNDPIVISQHDKMVAINVALEIDLTGQVCSDSIGYKVHSGIGGQVDFVRGAARSRQGKAIIAMPSTAKNDTVSRIVPTLTQGAAVVTSRGDVHYVVTEYGVAYLHGKSVRERAIALICIAHPKFRNELIQEAKACGLIFEDQIEVSWKEVHYPDELERNETLRDGTEIFFRPIKPTDEPALSSMLYSLSEQSVHTRYFTHTQVFPHRDVQQLTNIDYEHNLAIVGVVPGAGGDEQIVAIAQFFLDPREKAAEVAFIVQDEWQEKGMGTFLFRYLAGIAVERGIERFDASVLPVNEPMLNVFHNSGFPVQTEFDGDTYKITLDLSSKTST